MSLPSPVGAAAARASLQDEAFVRRSCEQNAEARAFTAAALQRLALPFIPSHANFLYFRAPTRQLPALLRQRGVDLTHTADPLEGDWARVSIGTLAEMKAFTRALESSL